MSNKQKGVLCAILGPLLWGVSGNVAQWLFDSCGLKPDWLVAVRLLGSGILLLAWCLLTQPQEVQRLVKSRWALGHAALFGLGGIVVSQMTYFMAVATSNAPTTTVLQYLGPLFIVLYLALKTKKWPRRVDMISLVIAFAGIYLLVTHGRLNQLAITPMGLMWGIGSGFGAALYTLLPVKLLTKYNATAVTGVAMMVAGLVLSPILMLQAMPHLTWPIILGILYVTLFGTMGAYLLYMQSLKYIRPTTVGMLNVFEPLSSTLVAIAFFHTSFGPAEVIGGLLVLSTTFLQTLPLNKMLHHRKAHIVKP